MNSPFQVESSVFLFLSTLRNFLNLTTWQNRKMVTPTDLQGSRNVSMNDSPRKGGGKDLV